MVISLSEVSINFFKDLITGDSKVTPYKSGPELVSFFNDLGFKDEYGNGFPSRWYYVQQKLIQINDTIKMRDCLIKYFNPQNFIDNMDSLKEVVNNFNKRLNFDGFKIIISGKKVQIVDLNEQPIIEKNSNIDNEFVDKYIAKSEKLMDEGDFEGVITISRTIVETMLLDLYKKNTKLEFKYNGKLSGLFKEVRRHLNMDIKPDIDDCLKKILSGLDTIISGLAELRNKMSDAHGKISKKYIPSAPRKV